MTTEKLLRSFIYETIVDASSKFKQKRSRDFNDKLQKIAGNITNMFAKQEDQEKFINDSLESIRLIPDEIVLKGVSKKRLALKYPSLFDEDDGWSINTSLFDIISLVTKDDWDYVFDLVSSNADSFEQSLAEIDIAVNELIETAESMDWPAPWRRYTRWATFHADFMRYKNVVNSMLNVK